MHDHAADVLLRDAVIEERLHHVEVALCGGRIVTLAEIGVDNGALGADPIDPVQESGDRPSGRWDARMVHGHLVLDVGAVREDLLHVVPVGADDEVGVMQEESLDTVLLRGREPGLLRLDVEVTAGEEDVGLGDQLRDADAVRRDVAVRVEDRFLALLQVGPRRGEPVVVAVRIDVLLGRHRRRPHGTSAHLDRDGDGRGVDPAHFGVERDTSVSRRRGVAQEIAHRQQIHHGVVVVRLDQDRAHSQSRRIVRRLDVVQSSGERAGARVGVQIDGAVDDLQQRRRRRSSRVGRSGMCV